MMLATARPAQINASTVSVKESVSSVSLPSLSSEKTVFNAFLAVPNAAPKILLSVTGVLIRFFLSLGPVLLVLQAAKLAPPTLAARPAWQATDCETTSVSQTVNFHV